MTAAIVVIVGPAPNAAKRDALAIIIDAILDRRRAITAAELADSAGWKTDTARAYLETFRERGMLRVVTEPERRGCRPPRRYRLGPDLIRLARAIVASEDETQWIASARIRPETYTRT